MLQQAAEDSRQARDLFNTTVKRLTRRKMALKEHNKCLPRGKELQLHQKPGQCKRLTKRQLSAAVVDELHQAVRREMLSHAQAAARFGISVALVGRLIRKMKAEPELVEELRAKETAAETKFQATVAAIAEEEEHGIWTAEQVASAIWR